MRRRAMWELSVSGSFFSLSLRARLAFSLSGLLEISLDAFRSNCYRSQRAPYRARRDDHSAYRLARRTRRELGDPRRQRQWQDFFAASAHWISAPDRGPDSRARRNLRTLRLARAAHSDRAGQLERSPDDGGQRNGSESRRQRMLRAEWILGRDDRARPARSHRNTGPRRGALAQRTAMGLLVAGRAPARADWPRPDGVAEAAYPRRAVRRTRPSRPRAFPAIPKPAGAHAPRTRDGPRHASR